LGMFSFDMIISLIAGIGLMGFAVGLKLLSFKDAPLDWLIAVVIVSGYVLNASTMIFTLIAGSKASVLSLFAACLVFASAAASALFNLLLYPRDGSWPVALSLIPFFAQGRALYILLAYQRFSAEVMDSLLLMFAVGTVFLIFALVMAEKDEVLQFCVRMLHDSEKAPTLIDQEALPEGGELGHEAAAAAAAASVYEDSSLNGLDLTAPTSSSLHKMTGAATNDVEEPLLGAADNPTTTTMTTTINAEVGRDLRKERERAANYVRSQDEARATLSTEKRQQLRREPSFDANPLQLI